MNERLIIAKTGSYTAIISYLIFFVADYVRPGFVSRVLSVHWWLLAIAIFGVWWAVEAQEREQGSRAGYLIASFLYTFVALCTLWLVWKEGDLFGDFRAFVALLIASLPLFAYLLLRSPK